MKILLVMLTIGAFLYWEVIEATRALEVANILVTSANAVLIVYETHSQPCLCVTWTSMWTTFIAYHHQTLDRKNPLTISALAFAFRLVMLQLKRKQQ